MNKAEIMHPNITPNTFVVIDESSDNAVGPYRFSVLSRDDVSRTATKICDEAKALAGPSSAASGFDLGSRLKVIREAKLYRQLGHNSYTAYFRAVFGHKSQSSRLISSAELLAEMQGKVAVYPTRCFQVEALLRFPPGQAIEIWNTVVETNGHKVPSGQRVRQHVRKEHRQPRAAKPLDVPAVYRFLEISLSQPQDEQVREILGNCLERLWPFATTAKPSATENRVVPNRSPLNLRTGYVAVGDGSSIRRIHPSLSDAGRGR